MITCEVLLPHLQFWIVIYVVYASNSDETRKELWEELVDLFASQFVDDKPWIILGNFNQILHPLEHSNPASLNVGRKIQDFRECLIQAELYDLVSKGIPSPGGTKAKPNRLLRS